MVRGARVQYIVYAVVVKNTWKVKLYTSIFQREENMQTVSAELVERTWKRMARMPSEEVPRIIDRMDKEQPEILGFLLGIDYDVLNEDERKLLLYLGTVIWEIMRQGTPRPKRVSAKRMNQFIDRTDKMTEYLMGESTDDFETSVVKIFQEHNQINVLRYAVEALFEMEEEDRDEIREEIKGLIFMNIKTIVEALDQ
jgi:hypothetical protein